MTPKLVSSWADQRANFNRYQIKPNDFPVLSWCLSTLHNSNISNATTYLFHSFFLVNFLFSLSPLAWFLFSLISVGELGFLLLFWANSNPRHLFPKKRIKKIFKGTIWKDNYNKRTLKEPKIVTQMCSTPTNVVKY